MSLSLGLQSMEGAKASCPRTQDAAQKQFMQDMHGDQVFCQWAVMTESARNTHKQQRGELHSDSELEYGP